MKWIYNILGEKRLFNKRLKSKYRLDFLMLLQTHEDILQFETENSFHTNSFLENYFFSQFNNCGFLAFWNQTLHIIFGEMKISLYFTCFANYLFFPLFHWRMKNPK